MERLLPDLASTLELGRTLAEVLRLPSTLAHGPAGPIFLPMFFYGDVGMGKTTCISALVRSLPGGDAADTGSPSFTLCNLYPTRPPVAHFDLYRQESGLADESFLDFLEEGRHVVLIEWAERLPEWMLPPDRLSCHLLAHGTGRVARFDAHGLGSELLARLEESWPEDPQP